MKTLVQYPFLKNPVFLQCTLKPRISVIMYPIHYYYYVVLFHYLPKLHICSYFSPLCQNLLQVYYLTLCCKDGKKFESACPWQLKLVVVMLCC